MFPARCGPLLLVIAGGGVFVMIGIILLVLALQDGSGAGLFTGVIGVISAGHATTIGEVFEPPSST